MIDEDLAWAAGLFEGEGCVGHYGGTWRAAIQMSDFEPLEWFGETVGLGGISGPYETRLGYKPRIQWAATRRDEVEALYDLIGHRLSPRRLNQFESTLSIPWRGRGSGPRGVHGQFVRSSE